MHDNLHDVRFAFGKNWQGYAKVINEERVKLAEISMQEMLGLGALKGKTFLDIGSGSGLFSLSAIRLGAKKVLSFDYDLRSVECAQETRRCFAPDAANWSIEQGSILNADYCAKVGSFDIVYSWGVLHHTGNMYAAFEETAKLVSSGGILFISIYNNQGFRSRLWKLIKLLYNKAVILRPLITGAVFFRFWFLSSLKDILHLRPFRTLRQYRGRRGMSAWHDTVDWVGGYPFEYASPEVVKIYFCSRGFSLINFRSVGAGHGCNEFVFKRIS
jgi:2-polyprenyl-6-hydroxyphenyl methylase/3-demethylubiquinone-9 3-methyltransferase